jgi:hypothetical protein
VDEGKKDPYSLHSEDEKAIKEIKDKKAPADDNVPQDVLKLLGEDGLKIITQLTNIHETGEWPKDFTEVTVMTALQNNPKLQSAATITQSASSHIQQR